MKYGRHILLSTALILLAASAFAQDYDTVTDLEIQSELAAKEAAKEGKAPNFGGWLVPQYISDRKESKLSSINVSAKLWAKADISDFSFYVRGKDTYWHVTEEKDVDIKNNKNKAELDILYANYKPNRYIDVYAGRKFYLAGTGLALNGRADGGEVNLYSKYADFSAFGAYSGLLSKDSNPYGLSTRDLDDGSKRIFAGATVKRMLFNQEIFLFELVQMDKGDNDEGSNTKYNSQYTGIGFSSNTSFGLSYNAEFIYEMGKSYKGELQIINGENVLVGLNKKNEIAACAGRMNLDYFINTILKPTLSLSYAYGSGDKDREGAKLPNGNTKGKDNGFIGFGTFVGGYGLRPTLSNIHVISGGLSLSPFSESDSAMLNRMNFGAKYFYYLKDKKEGSINNGEAYLNNKNIGQGIDVSLKWKLFYDISLFADYGLFLPGKAYESGTKKRHFTMTGIYMSF